MKKKECSIILFCLFFSCSISKEDHVGVEHKKIYRIDDMMPDAPVDYKLKDFKAITLLQDSLLFDENASGPHLPIIQFEDSMLNGVLQGFTFPSYIGSDGRGEALSSIGAVVGASLVGIDKSGKEGGDDYLSMLKRYYNTDNGENLVLNGFRAKTGSTFWYEIFPSVAFSKLVDLYPSREDYREILRSIADRWLEAVNSLINGDGHPDFDYTAFNFSTMKPFYNGIWKEPDAAAGVAWLEYMAYIRFGEDKYLQGAIRCMEFLQHRPLEESPYYEILMPYGALLAARMNAEQDSSYDLDKMIRFSIDGNNSNRKGWGVIIADIHGTQMHGLVGQQNELYAFAMNTFDQLSTMVPIVRYSPEYARAIGKWVLNAASACRLFYQDEHPESRQTSFGEFLSGEYNPISYEGARGTLDGGNFEQYKSILSNQGPYGVGDRKKARDKKGATDFCPYGSAWVGELAAIIKPTDVEKILQIDCTVTDFFNPDKCPTYLYYNPYKEAKKVSVEFDTNTYPKADLYDMITKCIIARSASSGDKVKIEGSGVVLLVVIPEKSNLKQIDNKIILEEKIIDYNYSKR